MQVNRSYYVCLFVSLSVKKKKEKKPMFSFLVTEHYRVIPPDYTDC